MPKIIVLIRYIVFVLFVIHLSFGCGKQDESLQKSRVVSKKVTAGKEKQLKPQKSTAKNSVKKDNLEKKLSKPGIEIPDKAGAEKKKKSFSPVAFAKISAKGVPLDTVYNPKGKIDPFQPLFQNKPKKVATNKKLKKRRIRRTPLEKIDIGQLKLTGIIFKKSGNKALVEEASGKGYIIAKGTPIGTRWGKVVKIKKESVIVEEEGEDIMGKITLEKRELKLLKPLGEE